MVVMEKLSSKYGWKPDEIRNMSHEDVWWYKEIIAADNFISQAQQKKHRG